VEIYEDAAPEEIVDFHLPRDVLGHEPLERARLGAAEVVDVQIGIPIEPRVNEVDESLERLAFALAVVGPECLVPGLGAVEEKKAEEVFEPAGRLEERVPFQIEDHVAGRARRKGGEAAARLDGEGSPLQGARALPDQLKPRLIAQATECGGGHLGDGGPGEGFRERGQRVDSAREQPLHLVPVDAGHTHDVILALQAVIAERPEVAERAVVAGIGTRLGPGRHHGAEALANAPVVGRHVGEADGHTLPRPQHDISEIGRYLLDLLDGLAIEGELQRVLRPRMPRQLRIQDLVAPVAQHGGPVHALQEVRDPAPAAREEDGLIDVVGACAHGVGGAPGCCLEVAGGAQVHLDHRAAGGAERVEEGLLVLLALPPEQLGVGVLVARPAAFPEGHGQLQLRQMLAGEEAPQVRGREEELVVQMLHVWPLSDGATAGGKP
jgi:hypothetical protein